MPVERDSITRKLHIKRSPPEKDLEGYITVGLYQDKTPGEVFLTFDHAGSFERGLCHALALVISLAFQRGVPIQEIASKLTGLKFEPAGFTGKPDIPSVHSIADYIGQWLTLKFGDKK
jgi:ribonucleoside-diphosphate reductase alpha chain